MNDTFLTKRQIDVIRYRKKGMTQQQIADIFGTSKANICTIEKSANENIQRAKDTLELVYLLDSTLLCTIPVDIDVIKATSIIYESADMIQRRIQYNSLDLINYMRKNIPQKIKGRCIIDEIQVFITNDGELYFE